MGRQRGPNSAHALSKKSPTSQVLVARVPEKTVQFHSTPACSGPSSPVSEDLDLSIITSAFNMAEDDIEGELRGWIREEQSDYVKGIVQNALDNWAEVQDSLDDYTVEDVFT